LAADYADECGLGTRSKKEVVTE